MPTYEYRCSECGHGFEESQSINAEALLNCPNCSKPALKRLLGGGGGMIFKGSGFYKTDYKAPRATSETQPSAKPEASSAVKKDAPTDSKPTSTPKADDAK